MLIPKVDSSSKYKLNKTYLIKTCFKKSSKENFQMFLQNNLCLVENLKLRKEVIFRNKNKETSTSVEIATKPNSSQGEISPKCRSPGKAQPSCGAFFFLKF